MRFLLEHGNSLVRQDPMMSSLRGPRGREVHEKQTTVNEICDYDIGKGNGVKDPKFCRRHVM